MLDTIAFIMNKIIGLLLISLVLSGCSSNQGFSVYPTNEREEFDHIYKNIREIQGKLDALIETNPNTKTKWRLYLLNDDKKYIRSYLGALKDIKDSYKPEYCEVYSNSKNINKTEKEHFLDRIKSLYQLQLLLARPTLYGKINHTGGATSFKQDFNFCVEHINREIERVSNNCQYYSMFTEEDKDLSDAYLKCNKDIPEFKQEAGALKFSD